MTFQYKVLQNSELFVIPFLHQTTTCALFRALVKRLFVIPFLHQTTTFVVLRKRRKTLFAIPFLHQTTTYLKSQNCSGCCSSFLFYIKPQLSEYHKLICIVVRHSFSTSNHNIPRMIAPSTQVVRHSFSTSNHNELSGICHLTIVVRHSFSTSNHN